MCGLSSALRSNQIILILAIRPGAKSTRSMPSSSSHHHHIDVFTIVIYICLCPLPKGTTPSLSFPPASRHFHPVLPCLHYQLSSFSCISCHRSHQSARPPPFGCFTVHLRRIFPSFLQLSPFLFLRFQWAPVYPTWTQSHSNSMQRLKKFSKGSVLLLTLCQSACGKLFCRVLSPPPRF